MDEEVGILLSQINTEIGILIGNASNETEAEAIRQEIMETAHKINDLIREYAKNVK